MKRNDSLYYYNKGNPFFHFFIGNSLINLQKYQEAVTSFDKAIKLNSNDSNYYYNTGKALDNLQQHQEAINCFDQAINLNQNDPDYQYNKGIALSNLHQYEEAVNCYNYAINLNPNDSNYFCNKDIALLIKGTHLEGETICINIKKQLVVTIRQLIQIQMIQIIIAIKVMLQTICINIKKPLIAKIKPLIQIQMIQIIIAIKALHYQQKKPISILKINNLHKYQEVISYYDLAINLNPNDSDYYYNKGATLV